MVLITFKFYDKQISVQAKEDQMFGEVILNNESKIGLNLRNKKYKFLYNGYELKLTSSKTLLELGLNKNPIITIIDLDITPIIGSSEFGNLQIHFNFGNKHEIIQCNEDEQIEVVFNRCLSKIESNQSDYKFYYNGREFYYWGKTLKELGLNNFFTFDVVLEKHVSGAGPGYWLEKEINIKFIKISENISNDNVSNYELIGLLKLCFLKELSSKLSYNQIMKLPELTYYIMRILKNGYIEEHDVKETIQNVLKKIEGSNIINFSEFVDQVITKNQINEMLNLLDPNILKIMKEIEFRLSKYNDYIKIFNTEFERAKKESIFEFSIISLVIIERQDFEKFEKEREKCPNRIDKILFHGTSIEPISCILTGLFRKSVDRCYQHGKGVYFTDFLDYCWFYGGQENNRVNKNKIPRIKDNFTLIACSVYFDKKGFRRVIDYKYTPKKNEINFAYAGAKFETIVDPKPNFNKFVGTEYVIWDLDQICPFMSAKLERNEFCVIWRDNNFSSKPIYNNKFDPIFKNFLNERIRYIKQVAKYNIYPCETSEEALRLIERKKYNKIILISNIGSDLGGKDFVTKARKILGNDVIVLFLAYNIDHLKWVKDFKNALFSNDPKFYEDYLQCFDDNWGIKRNIKSLIEKVEKHYNVKFNFDDNFLKYPLFKESGNYSDLEFNF